MMQPMMQHQQQPSVHTKPTGWLSIGSSCSCSMQRQRATSRGQRRRRVCAVSASSLEREFAAHVNELDLRLPHRQLRRPSPLEPPTAVVAAQLDALQMNDYPDTDAGVLTALAFAKPLSAEEALPAASGAASGAAAAAATHISDDAQDLDLTRVRSWSAAIRWLTPREFAAELHSPPFSPLLGCDSWRVAGPIAFVGTRAGGQRAIQAVEVVAAAAPATSSSSSRGSSSSRRGGLQRFVYSFMLERISGGSLKGCWLTVGVRPGNYSV